MTSVTVTPPASKPITVAGPSPDPWYEDRPVHAVDKAALAFGVRVRHRVIPGTWKVVREAQRMDACRSTRIRVREQADNGSLVGPVLSWNVAEVVAIVGDEPKAEPTPVEAPEPVQEADTPLVVAMVLSIDGTHYAVAPLAPAPDAVKAFRFTRADETASYDLDQTATGASCSCPDFIWRRDGQDPLGCKHIRAARMMGLISEAPEPACCPADESAPCRACLTHDGPADLSDDAWDDDYVWSTSDFIGPDDDDPEVRELIDNGAELEAEGEGPLEHATPEVFRAIAEGRAEPMREFGQVPAPGYVTRENAEDLAVDEAIGDGWAEYRDRERAEGMKAKKAAMAADDDAPDRTLDLDLADQIDDVADAYRSKGAFGAFLAKQLDALSARARFLEATTPEAFEDRLATMLDRAALDAEARMASRRG